MLAGPPGTNLSVAVLDIQFVLAQQPFAQVTVNLVDTLSEFMNGNFAEMSAQAIRLHFVFQPGSERIGVRFN